MKKLLLGGLIFLFSPMNFGASVTLRDLIVLNTLTPTNTNAYVFASVPLTATTSTPYKLNLSKTNLSILSGESLISVGDIDSQVKFENAVGWTLPSGSGSALLINGTTVTNANFTNSATALIEAASVTNISIYPTNLANAQISASAAIDFSKLSDVQQLLSSINGYVFGDGSSASLIQTNDVSGTDTTLTYSSGAVTLNGAFNAEDLSASDDLIVSDTATIAIAVFTPPTNTITIVQNGIKSHTQQNLGDSTNITFHTHWRDSYRAFPTNNHTVTLSGSLTDTNSEINYLLSITVATNNTLTTWASFPGTMLLNGVAGGTTSTNQLGENEYTLRFSAGTWKIYQSTAPVDSSLLEGTLDTSQANFTFKMSDFKDFVYPARVDGVGCVINTNDYSSFLWGLADYSGSADTNGNYGIFRLGTVPYDLDTAIELTLRGVSIRVSGSDADAVEFTIAFWSPASSSGFTPTDFTSLSTFINFDSGALSSPAAQDVFYLSDVTLTGWAAGLTAGRPFVIGIARRDGSNDDTVSILSGTIAYGRTQ